MTTITVTHHIVYVVAIGGNLILRQSQDIAELFRDGRARAGWSQAELAARVGVSRQWISLVETERRASSSIW
jgi:DNA-binding XRE family transcriptional regulator